MKKGFLYLIVDARYGHDFELNSLVELVKITGDNIALAEDENGVTWWVNPKEIIEIGEI
jgi:hypothetical protein